ncbi:molybdenum cofactor guanylyltransferase [Nocardioides sp.]|uniref:molybdenum cofactor guanylyltransferase n=1 Tax=Nocardioides sp. TaxID=35761 RepID=UPI002736C141|nr:NTP transferase domain-containing protein [Nocardioides sp.]MDP3890952.1 NTP transferase domain-containing protein [Nocardioides sp.]
MDFDLGAAGFCAVILAGGTAARMGGVDKASVEHAGRSLLAHAIDALIDADEVVVVGKQVPTERPVTFVREDPPQGGPVAGLLAGVDMLLRRPRTVGVLAVDMPHVTAATFRRLREGAAGRDGAFLVDASAGRRQLAGVLDAGRLAEVSPGLEQRHGMPMHRLLDPLSLIDVAAVGREAVDVDTWADLRDLRDG